MGLSMVGGKEITNLVATPTADVEAADHAGKQPIHEVTQDAACNDFNVSPIDEATAKQNRVRVNENEVDLERAKWEDCERDMGKVFGRKTGRDRRPGDRNGTKLSTLLPRSGVSGNQIEKHRESRKSEIQSERKRHRRTKAPARTLAATAETAAAGCLRGSFIQTLDLVLLPTMGTGKGRHRHSHSRKGVSREGIGWLGCPLLLPQADWWAPIVSAGATTTEFTAAAEASTAIAMLYRQPVALLPSQSTTSGSPMLKHSLGR